MWAIDHKEKLIILEPEAEPLLPHLQCLVPPGQIYGVVLEIPLIKLKLQAGLLQEG